MRFKFSTAWVAAVFPALVSAAWQGVLSEPGRQVEIDRESIVVDAAGGATAVGRVVLDRPIVDPKTSASYRIIEVQDYFDCAGRTLATQKRTYYKEEGEVLRQEEVKSPFAMPVRSGTPDEKLFREACRPKGANATNGSSPSATKTVEKINEMTADVRKANDELVAKAVEKDLQKIVAASATKKVATGPVVDDRPATKPPATHRAAPRIASRPSSAYAAVQQHAAIHWGYEGAGAPENWGRLSPEYALCGAGKRQSPIDIRDGIRVDLEPIQFDYRPARFRVIDNGHTVQVTLPVGQQEAHRLPVALAVRGRLLHVALDALREQGQRLAQCRRAAGVNVRYLELNQLGQRHALRRLLRKGDHRQMHGFKRVRIGAQSGSHRLQTDFYGFDGLTHHAPGAVDEQVHGKTTHGVSPLRESGSRFEVQSKAWAKARHAMA